MNRIVKRRARFKPNTGAVGYEQTGRARFLASGIEARDLSHIGDYMAPDMVQHTPTMTDGIAGFSAYSPNFWKGQARRAVEPALRNPPAMVLADGDLVQLVFRRPTPDPTRPGTTYDRYTFDLCRIAGGKIVEHWDNVVKPALEADPK